MYTEERSGPGAAGIIPAGIIFLFFLSGIGNLILYGFGIQIENPILAFFAGVIVAIVNQAAVFFVGVAFILIVFVLPARLIKKAFVAIAKRSKR